MKKVLLIDDDINILELLKSRLEASGYKILTALDGEEGLEKLRSEKPDIIILDILMPRLDGYSFVREIKTDKNTRHIPIIILTAKSGMKDLFEMEGIKDYFVKPFKAEDLLKRIAELIHAGAI